MKCRWCGLDHPPGGPSRTKEWIACREALGNVIVKYTSALKEVISVLGPKPASCGCQGCDAEMGMALDAAETALGMKYWDFHKKPVRGKKK